ncbi:MAG: hypothetical protein HZB53_18360 [Chloroflexi bacterium]|nr:hypothetical protein [Chloroflexota bacterium]
MNKANPPLDPQAEKLLKQFNQALEEMLAASSGTALGVAYPRLKAAADALARYRYRQIGAIDAVPARK